MKPWSVSSCLKCSSFILNKVGINQYVTISYQSFSFKYVYFLMLVFWKLCIILPTSLKGGFIFLIFCCVSNAIALHCENPSFSFKKSLQLPCLFSGMLVESTLSQSTCKYLDKSKIVFEIFVNSIWYRCQKKYFTTPIGTSERFMWPEIDRL